MYIQMHICVYAYIHIFYICTYPIFICVIISSATSMTAATAPASTNRTEPRYPRNGFHNPIELNRLQYTPWPSTYKDLKEKDGSSWSRRWGDGSKINQQGSKKITDAGSKKKT